MSFFIHFWYFSCKTFVKLLRTTSVGVSWSICNWSLIDSSVWAQSRTSADDFKVIWKSLTIQMVLNVTWCCWIANVMIWISTSTLSTHSGVTYSFLSALNNRWLTRYRRWSLCSCWVTFLALVGMLKSWSNGNVFYRTFWLPFLNFRALI